MEKRPPRPRLAGGPVSGASDAETPVGRGETPLPENQFDEWSALGSTRVLPHAPEAGTPTQLNADDTALPPPNVTGCAPAEKKIAVVGELDVGEKVGEGAMGAVYKAYQPAFKRVVALKILFKHVANNPKLVERLYREGLVMGQLDHPNIVAAYGNGEDRGLHYIAMEFVDGESLQKWINRVGRFDVGDALHVVLTCARALQYAHEAGLVHRDVKPDNVLITRDGQIKVTDLGMVKTSDEDMALTQTGHAVGTPWYMPLEQARNAKNIDARSDIYALGCMLYCLITGEPPFAGKTLVEVIQAKEVGTFPPARSVSSEVPERLDLIISKMTAKLPRYRYQTCAEVITDLEGLNLTSANLGFLTAAAGEAPKRRTASTPAPPSSADSGEDKPEEIWYLRYKTPEGQTVIRKLTAPKILRLLEDKSFDPTAQASRKANEGFRALATYKEFEAAALSRVAKDAVDEKTVRFRNLYKKIEAQEMAREKVKQEQVNTTSYWGGIIFKIGGLCAAAAFLIFMLWYFATGLGK